MDTRSGTVAHYSRTPRVETTKGYLHPDLRHITKAAEFANAFLDAQADALGQQPRPLGKRPDTPGR